jgi:predicted neuraminidase
MEYGTIAEPIFQAEAVGTAECHASTVLALANNEYLCAWFAGTREGNPDTAIWLSRRQAGSWSPPEQVAKVTQEAHWNPVLFWDAENIYLFFKVGLSPREWRTYWMSRPLDVIAWSQPQELIPGDIGGRGPVKNKLIKLQNGDWLAPASIETNTVWDCFVDRSSDRGTTWQRSNLVPCDRSMFPGLGIIQPTLWESSSGNIHMLTRSNAGSIYRSDSQDDGQTWSHAYPTELPNNNSGIDLVRLDDGSLILAYNPVSKNWGLTTPLKLIASKDNGGAWTEIFVLEDEPGEYSYPAIVKTNTGFAVSYTKQRQQIQFWEFTNFSRV